jgi:hypothetical protein
MITLRTLLLEARIDSKDSLRHYADEKYQAVSPVPLRVVRSIDLELDDESRTYRERLEFENTIFDVPNLLVANSRYVSFINCIFMGNVTINQKITEIKSIYFDYCIFSGSLRIASTEKVGSVTLNSVNAGDVALLGVGSPSMDISNCRIGNLLIAECEVTEFQTFCNEFFYVDIGSNKFGHVSFSHSQLNIKNQPALPDKRLVKKISESFSEFFFAPEHNLDKMSATEKKRLRSSTFRFLATHSDIDLNREAMGHLKYLQVLAYQPNKLLRWIQVVIGGFVMPLRIAKLAFIILTTFALFFCYLPCCQFFVHNTDGASVVRSLTFAEAFYYSGITFTTIGYGDISPIGGWARFLAIIEGLFGLVLTSSFVVSLVRKYTE